MKKIKTVADIAAHEADKKAKRDYKSAITKARLQMITLCERSGLRTAQFQFEALTDTPELRAKYPLLSYAEIKSAYQDGITAYIESISEPA